MNSFSFGARVQNIHRPIQAEFRKPRMPHAVRRVVARVSADVKQMEDMKDFEEAKKVRSS